MVICKECGKAFLVLTHKHLKKHDLTRESYAAKYPGAVFTSQENFENLSKAHKGKKVGDKNPARRKEVRDQISKSVKKLWEGGSYKNRINGMRGVCGELAPSYKPEKHTMSAIAQEQYRKFLSLFEDISTCSCCGAKGVINVHHIDEDQQNFLPSNLEPLCVPCHSALHYAAQKQPFILVGKRFTFAAAHYLPEYEGDCQNLHGHEWTLDVSIKKRVNRKTGMVVDFSILKKIVQEYIISQFDHSYLNNYFENPTAENMLICFWEILMFDAHVKGLEEITLWETATSFAKLTKYGMLSVLSKKLKNN